MEENPHTKGEEPTRKETSTPIEVYEASEIREQLEVKDCSASGANPTLSKAHATNKDSATIDRVVPNETYAGRDGTTEKESVDSHVRISTPTSEGLETAPLESYPHSDKDPDGFVYFRQDNIEQPQLRKGKPNRVIVFGSCFNPPHRAHLELICNAFFSTDDCTIAVMIVPGNDDCIVKGKECVEFNGRSLVFTRQQRAQLWFHEYGLNRFVWNYPYSQRTVETLLKETQERTKADGFDLTFTMLTGADHESYLWGNEEPDWGFSHVIFSDVTRPSKWLPQESQKPSPMTPGRGWDEWGFSPPPPTRIHGSEVPCCDGKPCWVCWKLSRVVPEFFEKDFTEDPIMLAGDVAGIVRRCHEGKGTVWETFCKKGSADKCVWFIDSRRKYPDDDSRPQIIAAEVRRILGTDAKGEALDKLKDKALHP